MYLLTIQSIVRLPRVIRMHAIRIALVLQSYFWSEVLQIQCLADDHTPSARYANSVGYEITTTVVLEYLLPAEDYAGGEDCAGGFHTGELFIMEICPSMREKEARPFFRMHHPQKRFAFSQG